MSILHTTTMYTTLNASYGMTHIYHGDYYEIYSFCGNKRISLNQYTNEFWSHAAVHKDGFGYYLVDSNDYFVSKDSAVDCLSQLKNKNFRSKLALCHIRFKTHGPTAIENCHPFIKKDIHGVEWSLIHNGYIDDTTPYLDALNEFQSGETDSERVLLSIVETVNNIYEHAWIDNHEEMMQFIYSAIEKTIQDISYLGKVNLVFTDSLTNNMYVYMNSPSLYYLVTENGIHVSTTKLSNENWLSVPRNKLHIFNNGDCVDY